MKDQGTASLSLEEKRNRISALLRHVDAEVKTGNLDSALELTRQVYQYDTKNLYARALEERILVMKSDTTKISQHKPGVPKPIEPSPQSVNPPVKETPATANKESAESIPSPHKILASPVSEAAIPASIATKQIEEVGQSLLQKMNILLERKQHQMEEDFQRKINDLKSTITHPAEVSSHPATPIQQYQGNNLTPLLRYIEEQEKELQNKFYIERERIQDEVTLQIHEEQERVMGDAIKNLSLEYEQKLQSELQLSHEHALQAYRKALAALLHYKIPKIVQEDITRVLRQPLSISDDEHSQAEQFARVEAYVQEMREMYQKGTLNANDWSALSKLQSQLGISDDENKKLTRQVKKELGLPDESAVILVVDDDPVILRSTALLLEETYLNVITVDSIEKAEALLNEQTPDLIICDVSMPGTGGFTFFENIKGGIYGEPIKTTPFIFASGMGDKYIINSAKQLGARAYITKPFTQELLEQTVMQAIG